MTGGSSLPPTLLALKQRLASEHRSSEQDPISAVVAVILFEDEETGINTLLIHRAQRPDDPWSDQIGLPGGRVKETETSTPRKALKREVAEEVGLNLDTIGEELGPLSLGSPMRRTEIRVQPWVYGAKEKLQTTIGPEVTEAFWAPLSSLSSNSTTAEIKIRGERHQVDAFVVDGKIVWGFTHRVLTELLSIPEITAGIITP